MNQIDLANSLTIVSEGKYISSVDSLLGEFGTEVSKSKLEEALGSNPSLSIFQ